MKKYNLLKEVKQAILQEAIQGKLTADWRKKNTDIEPASELLKRIKAEKEKLLKEKKIKKEKPLPPITKEEIPFKLPKSWVWCRLGEISINRDELRKPISKKEREGRKKIYDYYGASGIIDKIDGYTHNGSYLLIGEDGSNLRLRTTSIAFEARGKFWVNNHAHSIQFINDKTQKYIKDLLNGIDLLPYITGGFQPKLNQINLNKILISLPPLAEQKAIVKKVESLMEQADAINKGANINKLPVIDKNAYQLLKRYSILKNILAEITKQKEYVSQLKQSILQEAIQGKLTADWRAKNSPPTEGWQTQSDGVVKPPSRNSKNYFSLPYNPKLKQRAKELRKAGNLSEVLFWNQVKRKKFLGLDFDRQKIIGNYIVDFYCSNNQVVIEIDGSSHDNKQEYDAIRDAYLKGLGLEVIHIKDIDVKKNINGIFEYLKNHIAFKNHPVLTDTPPKEGTPPRPEKIRDTPPKEGKWESASELLKRIKAEKEKLIKEKKIKKEKPLPPITKEEIPFKLPKGWVWCYTKELAELYTGNSINKTEKKTKYQKKQNGLVYIGTKDVYFDMKGINYNTEVIIPTKELYSKFKVAQKNTILVCIEGGSSGKKIALTTQNICFGNKLLATNTFINSISNYLYYLYNSPHFKSEFDQQRKGLRGGVSIDSFKHIKIPLPPLAEQKAIVKKVESLMKKVSAMEEEINKSEASAEMLMKAVLKEAFKGRKK